MSLHLSREQRELRRRIGGSLKKAGGNPAQAIPCSTEEGEIVWACPHKKGIITCSTLGNNPREREYEGMEFEGNDLREDHFPKPRPKEDKSLGLLAANTKNKGVIHNTLAQLAWRNEALRNLEGILLPTERKQEEVRVETLEKTLRKTLRPDGSLHIK